MRITAFATNTPRGQLPVLELRHRRRARCEDRIRNAKDMGLLKFPLQSFTQNQIWSQIVQLASELVAWMQTIAFTSDDARKWEPKRLRARLFEIPATLVRRSGDIVLHLARHTPEAVRVLPASTGSAPPSRRPDPAAPPVPTTPSTFSGVEPDRQQRTLRRSVTPSCQNQQLNAGNDGERPRSPAR